MTKEGTRSRMREGARRRLAPLLIFLLTGSVLACGGGEDPPAGPVGSGEDPLRVLFVGNSLTAANDLPALTATVAEAAGEEIEVGSVLHGGTSLEDQWLLGGAVEEIRTGDWDVVVLQQGPSSLPENRAHLLEWSTRFAGEIRAAGGRPALYMVWPSEARAFAFDAVSASYTNAARAVDGILFPAGEAWREAWRIDPGVELYGPDRFHPAWEGSVLAALVIYQGLFGRSPVGLPARLEPTSPGLPVVEVDEGVAVVLQSAAAEASRVYGFR